LIKSAQSGERSVLIFLTTKFIPTILNDSADSDPLRDYLSAGGRIVLLGVNPGGFINDIKTDTLIDIDFKRPGKLLGIKYNGKSFVEAMGGKYQSYSTEEGQKWGIKSNFISSFGINPEDADVVLALDEYGKASSWFKKYGSKNGGIIQIWVERTGETDLSFIKAVAEHGLK